MERGWLGGSGAAQPHFMFLLFTATTAREQILWKTVLGIYFINKYFLRHNYLGKARNSFSVLQNNSTLFG